MSQAYPDALVSTAWLADHLHDPHVRVIDATWAFAGSMIDAKGEFSDEHIPGAVFFDIDEIARPDTAPLPHMLPSPKAFAAKVGALGIGNDDFVVAYDTHGLQTAARAWWMFRVFGHDKVAVLDGGLPRWFGERRPAENTVPAPVAKTFLASFRPELVRGLDDVLATMDSGAEQLVDARNVQRFEGLADEPWPGRRRGHIPGSRNLPFSTLLDPATGLVLPAEALARRFKDAGIDIDRPVVCTCGSGITAAVDALALYLLGRPDAAIYDGSFAEWGLPGLLPIETGPAAP